jgi:hypothetical protein
MELPGFGLGTIVSFFLWLWKKYFLSPQKEKPSVVRLEVTASGIAASTIDPDSETGRIAGRLQDVLVLMNVNRRDDEFTIARFAQILQFRSVAELEDIFLRKSAASFAVLIQFSESFGINRAWLIEGKEAPYYEPNFFRSSPFDYYEDFEKLQPECLWFVRSKSKIGETLLVFQFSDWRYKVSPMVWHVSDHIGGTGLHQLIDLYKLISTLQAANHFMRCKACTLSEKNFFSLAKGLVFPGALLRIRFPESHWWDDFVDVNHERNTAEKYRNWHGESFVVAQSLVTRHLSEVSSSGR